MQKSVFCRGFFWLFYLWDFHQNPLLLKHNPVEKSVTSLLSEWPALSHAKSLERRPRRSLRDDHKTKNKKTNKIEICVGREVSSFERKHKLYFLYEIDDQRYSARQSKRMLCFRQAFRAFRTSYDCWEPGYQSRWRHEIRRLHTFTPFPLLVATMADLWLWTLWLRSVTIRQYNTHNVNDTCGWINMMGTIARSNRFVRVQGTFCTYT